MEIQRLEEGLDIHPSKPKQCDILKQFLTLKTFINILLSITILTVTVVLIYLCKNYLRALLFWIETQDTWLVFLIFQFLFIIVSFPITVGYLILLITSGYLFGIVKGLIIVVVCANIGVAVGHNTLKLMHNKLPVNRLIQNETTRGILRIISGPQAFKVIFFARLTPIPFGLQTLIFAVSTVGGKPFHLATLVGLLPAQTINVYLGSTLRSMHEVLADQRTALAGYCVLTVQLFIGVSLMAWVVHKARQELSLALQEAESLQGVCIDC